MKILLKLSNNTNSENLFKFDINELTHEALVQEITNKFSLNSGQFVLLTRNGIKINSKTSFHNGQLIQLAPTVLGGKVYI